MVVVVVTMMMQQWSDCSSWMFWGAWSEGPTGESIALLAAAHVLSPRVMWVLLHIIFLVHPRTSQVSPYLLAQGVVSVLSQWPLVVEEPLAQPRSYGLEGGMWEASLIFCRININRRQSALGAVWGRYEGTKAACGSESWGCEDLGGGSTSSCRPQFSPL